MSDLKLIMPSYRKYQMPSQPLGLYYIKAYLEKHGYSVDVQDLNIESLKFGPEKVVGVYVSTFLFNEAKQIILEAKKRGKIVVAGGVHVWSDAESLKELGVNFLVQGDGEISALKIMHWLDQNGYQENLYCPVLVNPVTNLDELPIPEHIKYPTSHVISTSRGCLFNCSFCSTGHIGKLIRFHSPERVVQEMSLLRGNDLAILDDLFTAKKKRLIQIQKLMQQEKLDVSITLGNGTRIDLADAETLKILRKMNIQRICYGVENIDNEVLKASNKHLTFKQIDDTIRLTQKMSIPLAVFMIIGLPYDNLVKVIKASEWVNKHGLEAFWNVATPYPRTELFEWVNKNGHWLIDKKDYSQYGGHFGNALKVVFDTDDFPAYQRIGIARALSDDKYPAHKRLASFILGKIGKTKREFLAMGEEVLPNSIAQFLLGKGQGYYLRREKNNG